MNLLTNKKSALLVLSTAAILAMTGCSDDCDDCDTCPTPPAETPGSVLAKDAMSMNAILYPAIAPLASCLGSVSNLLTCLTPDDTAAGSAAVTGSIPTDINTSGVYNCSVNDDDNSSGLYEITTTATSFKVEFGINGQPCYDYSNNQHLHEEVALAGCLVGAGISDDTTFTPPTDIPEGTYKVEYSGVVECNTVKLAGIDYSYKTDGNGDDKAKSKWTYNASLEMNASLEEGAALNVSADLNGTVRGEIDWMIDGVLTRTSDETWSFGNTNIKAYVDPSLISGGNILMVNGKLGYTSHLTNNEELYMNFTDHAYLMSHTNGDNIKAIITGGVDASCHTDVAEYSTLALVLTDNNNTRDVNGSRMPSAGSMFVSLPNGEQALSEFNENTSAGTAMVTITAGGESVDYAGWREVVTGSSCQDFQDLFDDFKK